MQWKSDYIVNQFLPKSGHFYGKAFFFLDVLVLNAGFLTVTQFNISNICQDPFNGLYCQTGPTEDPLYQFVPLPVSLNFLERCRGFRGLLLWGEIK